jgi:hypothetical protein
MEREQRQSLLAGWERALARTRTGGAGEVGLDAPGA